ncbi:MAG TPA: DAK2 domain-containing protein [Candidatus Elarobacter sp.]|jgi:dihydroxyacetone kinase|nr:DAK2 domain-containing protein [Candidatus Elarobacter sp.]
MSALAEGVAAVAARVRASADELNRLDAVAGDGDLGVTMTIAASAVDALVPSLANEPLAAVLVTCGGALARRAPSTGGTLLASALLRAGRRAAELRALDGAAAAELLEAAAAAIAERGGAQPGSKTILDALVPAARAARAAAATSTDLATVLADAADAARHGAEATKMMRPRFGRAGWLADRSTGHEDAGARLAAIVLAAIRDAVATA